MVEFSERLRDLRGKRTLREVADAVGIAQTYLSEMEHGRRIPSEETADKLAAFYGQDAEEFGSLAGILGQRTERYMKRNPETVQLLRWCSRLDAPQDVLELLIFELKRQCE